MAPRQDISWQALSGNIRIQGRFNAPEVSGHLLLTDGRVAGVSAKSLSLDASGNAGRVTLQGVAQKLTLPGANPNILAGAPLHFTAQADLQNKTRPVQLSLTHPIARLDAVAQTAGPLHVVADLTLPSLAPFGTLAKVPLAGEAALHAVVDQRDARRQARIDGSLR